MAPKVRQDTAKKVDAEKKAKATKVLLATCRRHNATQLQKDFLAIWRSASVKRKNTLLELFMEDKTCESLNLNENWDGAFVL